MQLIKSVYIEKRETALRNRQSDLQNDTTANAVNEKDLIAKQLKEIENLKSKTDELLAEGYNPVLDDGVGKNIAPLQKKGIIAYDVLNKGQLDKGEKRYKDVYKSWADSKTYEPSLKQYLKEKVIPFDIDH